MIELKWEEINHDRGWYMCRARVFGGWLISATSDVKTLENTDTINFFANVGTEWRTSITFIPDPNCEWRIKSESENNNI